MSIERGAIKYAGFLGSPAYMAKSAAGVDVDWHHWVPKTSLGRHTLNP